MPPATPPVTPLRILLASTSPWRRAMLETAGIVVEARDPGVDEAAVSDADPRRLAALRARAKAAALAGPGRIAIGADQVCHCEGVVYGKPAHRDEHRQQLCALRGRTHTLSDGVAVRTPDPVALGMILDGAERVVTVTDDEIAEAARLLFATTHNTAEGAGAAALAALMTERPERPDARIGVIMTGGNIDTSMFATILDGGTPRV
jgi:predicted house-cleaning NTP pyrophosphatase (Maf/HAM1 superfamily)